MPARAGGANSSGHGTVEPLRQLVLMKSHGKSLSVQELIVGEKFPLRPVVRSLASRSIVVIIILRILLRHAHKSISHRRKKSSFGCQRKKNKRNQEF